MVRRNESLRLEIRFNPREDADLIAWIEELKGRPHGYKSQEIKDTLRQGRNQGPTLSARSVPAAAPVTLDTQALAETLSKALVPGLTDQLSVNLLAEFRLLLEAAVLSALARSGGMSTTASPTTAQSTAQSEDLLTSMVSGMLLEEEEEA